MNHGHHSRTRLQHHAQREHGTVQWHTGRGQRCERNHPYRHRPRRRYTRTDFGHRGRARSTRDGERGRGQNVVAGRPPLKPQFGENDLSRNSRPQAHRHAAGPRRLGYPRPTGPERRRLDLAKCCCYGAPPQKQDCDNYPSRPRSRRTASGIVSSRSARAGASASAAASRTLSPSPGARKRFNSTPCCLVYNS